MKQIFSVFSLLTSHSLKPVLLTCFLLAMVQADILYKLGKNQLQIIKIQGELQSFSQWMDTVMIENYYTFAMGAVVAICMMEGTLRKAKYTLQRLGISNQSYFLAFFFNTFCCLFIVWATEILILFGAIIYYYSVTPQETVTSQSIFLASFHSSFLQGILPTIHGDLWLRRMMELLLISTANATTVVHMIWGEAWKFPVCILLFVLFSHSIQGVNLIFSLCYGILTFILLKGGLSNGAEERKL